MKRIKYVVVEVTNPMTMVVPVLLPTGAGHANVAKMGRVVSAGFCTLGPGEVHAWGESVGLNVKSRPAEDAKLISDWFSERTPSPMPAEQTLNA